MKKVPTGGRLAVPAAQQPVLQDRWRFLLFEEACFGAFRHAAPRDGSTGNITIIRDEVDIARYRVPPRHTAASQWLAAGVPLKDVAGLLGHSSISITADTYGHVLDDSRQAAARAMAARLEA